MATFARLAGLVQDKCQARVLAEGTSQDRRIGIRQHPGTLSSMSPRHDFAENPILVSLRRGRFVESAHRGAWVVTDGAGQVQAGAGEFAEPIFARSAVKCLQALPLIESGAAERFGYTQPELALALSSHNGESQHTRLAAGVLERLGMGADALQCGKSPAGDRKTREAMLLAGETFGPLQHNCSGKHAGFLTLAKHMDVPAENYLADDSASQLAVREAVLQMTALTTDELTTAIDGCSAPTFRMPLSALARSFAVFSSSDRAANSQGATRAQTCRTLMGAALAHPELIAGSEKRLCTALIQASEGRLFPKIGAEGVYAVGRVGHDQALAIKMDDGGLRGVNAACVGLLEHLGWLSSSAAQALEGYRSAVVLNAAKLEVGTLEVHI